MRIPKRSFPHRLPLLTARGIGLVELMVALLLGLFIIGGVITLFVNNQQASRSTEQLSRLQENARIAFELMARSLREAGGTPCGSNLPTGNVINNAASTWWADWSNGVRGYDGDDISSAVSFGTESGQRIAGTDAVFLVFADSNSGTTIDDHNEAAATFHVNTTEHGLTDGEIVVACDYHQAALFQVTNISSSSASVVHNTGTGSPGNCSKGLGYPTVCTALGTPYEFEGGHLVKLSAEFWYVGANSRGGRSLFRAKLYNNGGTPDARNEEIAEGVTDMQLVYLSTDAAGSLGTSYQEEDSVAAWPQVVAARLSLTLQSTQPVGVDGAPLQRRTIHVVSLRNRLP